MAVVAVLKVVNMATLRGARGKRALLVPYRQRMAIALGLAGPMLFGMLTRTGPVRALADWKLHRFGLTSGSAWTGVQLAIVAVIVGVQLALWLGKLREGELGPERAAAAIADAEARAKRSSEQHVALKILGGLVIAGLLMVGVMKAIFHPPPELQHIPTWLGWVVAVGGFLAAGGAVIQARNAPALAPERPIG